MASRKLTHFLTAPSRVASALDWKRLGGSVLSLDIGKDRIGMAIASHPSSVDGAEHVTKLESIQLAYETRHNRKVLNDSVLDKLQTVVNDNKVCAMVVGWPVQKEGNPGAPCGKVLHTLDCLIEESHILRNRPVCLWNEDMVVPRSPDSFDEDEWGRSPIWARLTKKQRHSASEEQYIHHEPSPDVAADIWTDFCASHWPEHCEAPKEEPKQAQEQFFDPSWVEDCESMNANLISLRV